jgi:hypothetical protein
MYKYARPAGTAYGLVYPRVTQGTLLSHTPYKIHNLDLKPFPPHNETCTMDVDVSTEFSRSLVTLVHIMYLLFFLFLLARRS